MVHQSQIGQTTSFFLIGRDLRRCIQSEGVQVVFGFFYCRCYTVVIVFVVFLFRLALKAPIVLELPASVDSVFHYRIVNGKNDELHVY